MEGEQKGNVTLQGAQVQHDLVRKTAYFAQKWPKKAQKRAKNSLFCLLKN
jgi:hypothetical protein